MPLEGGFIPIRVEWIFSNSQRSSWITGMSTKYHGTQRYQPVPASPWSPGALVLSDGPGLCSFEQLPLLTPNRRLNWKKKYHLEDQEIGTSLAVQWLRLCASNARGPGVIPGWGTRSHMPQLRVCMQQLKYPSRYN